MSDYDELGKVILICGVVSLITLPIWGPPYLVWWLVKGREEDKIIRERLASEEAKRKEDYEAWLAAHPKQLKPKLTPEQIVANEERVRRLLS